MDWDQFNQLYNLEWPTKETQFINTIKQKLMPASRKTMEQRQKARIKAAQMKKTLRKIDSRLSNQY